MKNFIVFILFTTITIYMNNLYFDYIFSQEIHDYLLLLIIPIMILDYCWFSYILKLMLNLLKLKTK